MTGAINIAKGQQPSVVCLQTTRGERRISPRPPMRARPPPVSRSLGGGFNQGERRRSAEALSRHRTENASPTGWRSFSSETMRCRTALGAEDVRSDAHYPCPPCPAPLNPAVSSPPLSTWSRPSDRDPHGRRRRRPGRGQSEGVRGFEEDRDGLARNQPGTPTAS